MKLVFQKWLSRYFADEEALVLLLILVIGMVLIVGLGGVLAPVIASVIIAFLLQGVIGFLVRYKVPKLVAVILAFLLFVGIAGAVFFIVLPLAWRQLTSFVTEFPGMLAQGQAFLSVLPQQYPELVSEAQISQWIDLAGDKLGQFGQVVVSFSISTLPNIVAVLIYIVLIPILVFFFLKDSALILGWFGSFLPENRPLMRAIWIEMNDQCANYVRGKAIEIVVVGIVSYVCFSLMGLNYAALLGLLVGISVVVPYVGAALVTIPVAMIALFQWGWSGDFFYLMLVYGIIQTLDGNVLVPLLFSEAVNMHPVAIILAVLIFGAFWGLWGVFFAIPLATLIKALLNAWPGDLRNQKPKPTPDNLG
jgi:putative permease